jgi:HK97 family phage major capsid protein/HK97 family phage prohead protease
MKMTEKIKQQMQNRTVEVRNVNKEDKTIELSFASSEPYERYWGVEILRIDENTIDFQRLNNSAPLLFNHDPDVVIGVVEKAWIEEGKAKAKVRFGNSSKAKEVWEDVRDGIMKNVSVGYQIKDMQLVEKREDNEVYEVTKWLPLEISIVSIPADNTVGVGRNLNYKEENMPESIKQTETKQETKSEVKVNVKEVEKKAREAERSRVAEISAIAEKFNKKDLAKESIEKGMSVDEFRTKILDELKAEPMIDTKNATLGMNEKEIKDYSLLRALRALSNPWDRRAQEEAKYEFEVSQEAQRKFGLEAKGILVPLDILGRTLTAGGDGGKVVPDKLLASQFIELLRNKSAILPLATQLTGLRGNIEIPRQIGSTTAYEVGETDALTDSDITLDQLTMSPKRLGASSGYSKQLLAQSSLDVENMIKNDILAQIALKLDAIAVNRILNETGVGLVECGSDDNTGGAPKWEHFVQLETDIAMNNADVDRMKYIINAKTLGYTKTTTKINGYPAYILEQNQINGYGAKVSNQVPANLAKGTSNPIYSAILFGNFADLLVGFWGGIDIIVDPYSRKKEGIVEITADQFYDLAVRRAESFAVIKDADV